MFFFSDDGSGTVEKKSPWTGVEPMTFLLSSITLHRALSEWRLVAARQLNNGSSGNRHVFSDFSLKLADENNTYGTARINPEVA